ncbi:response regulator [Nocardioides sp.]|uniref:response regulator n=1 Tax=Nocardioides sp. TaxID=35761 RepID=UPI0039E45776
MGEGASIRVFLVDDHEIVRTGVKALLEAEDDIEVVGEAGTASDAVARILEVRPDVCVLDVSLPDGSGIDVCREVRAADPGIKALILTTYDDDSAISQAILAGASGYVLKQIESGSLVSGVRLIASGHSLIDPTVTARVVEQVQFHRRAADLISDLTPRQSRILYLIAEGMTNREIAEELVVAEKTVKNHITGLLARLGVQHRTQAAVLALKLRGDVDDMAVPTPRTSTSTGPASR